MLIKKIFETLSLEYRQLIALPYISLTRQARRYQIHHSGDNFFYSHFKCQINILCFGEEEKPSDIDIDWKH